MLPPPFYVKAHFLDDQFETNRADGWKKLTSTAVPTIFCHRPHPWCRKAPVKHTSDVKDSTTEDVRLGDHTYIMLSVVKPKIHMQDPVQFDGYGSTTSASIELTDSSDIPICIVNDSTAGEDFWRQQASALAKQFNDTQQQLENLQQTHESFTRQIHQVFNEDQVTALSSAAGRMRSGTNGTVLKELVTNVIVKAESIGLRVASVTSDMGPANVALWRAFGVDLLSKAETLFKTNADLVKLLISKGKFTETVLD
ncbi:hypothetical protein Pmani_016508 [Petrolisthes manimaculis]|uniref:Transposable element P transposase-like RNase H domain-containing protein n=1 Tax=Petrolisthes manimaculis TaxID=1843537 RepID=A0AAE1PNQ9_9EUCA|nr:hypothetical protein Pmani_016508 [Petrolisthes manimaculis]